MSHKRTLRIVHACLASLAVLTIAVSAEPRAERDSPIRTSGSASPPTSRPAPISTAPTAGPTRTRRRVGWP